MDADEITKLAREAVEVQQDLEALPVIDEGIGPVTNEQRIAAQHARAVRSDWRRAFSAFETAATPEAWIAQADRIAAIEADRDEAVKALRPFSEEAQKWQQDDECPDLPDSCIPQIKHPDDDECDNTEFDVGDLREAARIISAHDKGE